MLAALLLAGCGGETQDSSTISPTATDTRPALQVARFAFTPDGLKPPTVTVEAAPAVTLQLVSEDGRPHGIVINVPQGRLRLLLSPGQTREETLTGLKAGRRYRVVPDGATEPAVLQVR